MLLFKYYVFRIVLMLYRDVLNTLVFKDIRAWGGVPPPSAARGGAADRARQGNRRGPRAIARDARKIF